MDCVSCGANIKVSAKFCDSCGVVLEGQQANTQTDTKQCPYCAEWIKNLAVKCRFCQSDLDFHSPNMNVSQKIKSDSRESHDLLTITSGGYANSRSSWRELAGHSLGGLGALGSVFLGLMLLGCCAAIGPGALVLLPFFGFPLYFIPTIVAALKGKKNFASIATLNLLLGWTVIGWIIALVWAMAKD
jgi:hypothetical protein